MSERAPSYSAFWPSYLRDHTQPATRALHYLGTTLGTLLLILAIVLAEPWLLLAAVVAGYGFAWSSHAFIEHNRPATFTHPLWSFISDFRMLWMWLTRRLDGELKAAGVE